MTPAEQFLTMAIMKSRITEDDYGNLIRIETRKCSRTGLVLTRALPVQPSREYLAFTPHQN